jgi:hypothetical protein
LIGGSQAMVAHGLDYKPHRLQSRKCPSYRCAIVKSCCTIVMVACVAWGPLAFAQGAKIYTSVVGVLVDKSLNYYLYNTSPSGFIDDTMLEITTLSKLALSVTAKTVTANCRKFSFGGVLSGSIVINIQSYDAVFDKSNTLDRLILEDLSKVDVAGFNWPSTLGLLCRYTNKATFVSNRVAYIPVENPGFSIINIDEVVINVAYNSTKNAWTLTATTGQK